MFEKAKEKAAFEKGARSAVAAVATATERVKRAAFEKGVRKGARSAVAAVAAAEERAETPAPKPQPSSSPAAYN